MNSGIDRSRLFASAPHGGLLPLLALEEGVQDEGGGGEGARTSQAN